MKADKKIKISIAAFLGIFLAFLFLGYLPLLSQIEENKEELFSARDYCFSLKERRANMKNTREHFSDFQEKVAEIDSLFLEYGNPVEVLDYLDRTARSCGVEYRISGFSFREGDTPYLSLGLNFDSEFSKFSKFLESLEYCPWFLQVESLSLRKKEDKVSCSLSLKIFCKKNGNSN